MDQKLENLLNLSLQSTVVEREKSINLDAGYDVEDGMWEVIVKYHSSIRNLNSADIIVEELINGYAIITLPVEYITALSQLEEIEYVEMPKILYFQTLEAKQDSCVTEVTNRSPFLTGNNVLAAVIDSGIDYTNFNFRNTDGTTRILSMWDQTLLSDADKSFFSPTGFQTGVEFSKEQIDAALALPTEAQTREAVPLVDISGHGTAVAGILAANGAGGSYAYSGVATECSLLIVKLGNPRRGGFPKTTELMRAITYALRKSEEYQMPLVINLSIGNCYGSHDGTSLLERFLDNAADIGRTSIIIASGNEGAAAGHSILQPENDITKVSEISVAPYESSLNLQIWKKYSDKIRIVIQSPSGERLELPEQNNGVIRAVLQETQLLIFAGEPLPYTVNQEIYIDFIPLGEYLNSGVWSIEMTGLNVVDGIVDLYLPSQAILNEETRFYQSTPQKTLTIPSTATKVITVGAYDTRFSSYAAFSGRGYVLRDAGGSRLQASYVKPDLVAPGVNIRTLSVGGGYSFVSGTSFAAPFVSGSAVLLMEWGIIRRNDIYLYGQKMKAYLINGARKNLGVAVPSAAVGWGALCVQDSLPI